MSQEERCVVHHFCRTWWGGPQPPAIKVCSIFPAHLLGFSTLALSAQRPRRERETASPHLEGPHPSAAGGSVRPSRGRDKRLLPPSLAGGHGLGPEARPTSRRTGY